MNQDFLWSLPSLCGMGLHWSADGFRLTLIALTILMFAVSGVMLRHYSIKKCKRLYITALLTLLGTAGVFLADDLFTLFVCFELMSLSSALWVFHDETTESRKAGMVYLSVSVLGGLCLFSGLILLFHPFQTVVISELAGIFATLPDRRVIYPACVLLLMGFGAKAGLFPLHIWMPGSYKAAPAPATALLAGLLSKTGAYGILLMLTQFLPGDLIWGRLILILALINLLVGGLRALLCGDLLESLAYSSMSQMGLLLLGAAAQGLLGNHSSLPMAGMLLLMIVDAVSKSILFHSAGLLREQAGDSRFSLLRGIGRQPLAIRLPFLLASLSTCGIPLLGGYLSKTLLHEGLSHALHKTVLSERLIGLCELLFYLGSAISLAYLLKNYLILFGKRRQNEGTVATTPSIRIVLSCCVAILLLMGCMPDLSNKLAAQSSLFTTEGLYVFVSFYGWKHMLGVLPPLGIGCAIHLLYAALCKGYTRRKGLPEALYCQEIWAARLGLLPLVYEPLLATWLPKIGHWLATALSAWVEHAIHFLQRNIWNGNWDLDVSIKGGEFGLFPAKEKRPHSIQSSMTWTVMLFFWGLCLLILGTCVAHLSQ